MMITMTKRLRLTISTSEIELLSIACWSVDMEAAIGAMTAYDCTTGGMGTLVMLESGMKYWVMRILKTHYDA
jgi:hypothetical protein